MCIRDRFQSVGDLLMRVKRDPACWFSWKRSPADNLVQWSWVLYLRVRPKSLLWDAAYRVFTRSSKRPANFQQMYSKYTWIAGHLLNRVNTPLIFVTSSQQQQALPPCLSQLPAAAANSCISTTAAAAAARIISDAIVTGSKHVSRFVVFGRRLHTVSISIVK